MITLKKFHLPRPLGRGLFKRQQVRGFPPSGRARTLLLRVSFYESVRY